MILILSVCYWNFSLSSPFILLHLFVPCLVRHLTRNCFYACVFASLTLFVRFLSYLWYTILIGVFYDVFPYLSWCIVIYSTLVFRHIHLVITNLSVQLCKVHWESFHALLVSCSTLFVGHDFASSATYLVSSPWHTISCLGSHALVHTSLHHFDWLFDFFGMVFVANLLWFY